MLQIRMSKDVWISNAKKVSNFWVPKNWSAKMPRVCVKGASTEWDISVKTWCPKFTLQKVWMLNAKECRKFRVPKNVSSANAEKCIKIECEKFLWIECRKLLRKCLVTIRITNGKFVRPKSFQAEMPKCHISMPKMHQQSGDILVEKLCPKFTQ